jgi:hypothetical protein
MKAKKPPVTGSVAANAHEGSRSELLADYMFSGWGTVTPVRRQDDHGIDLYCTLTERVGKRAQVTDYFVVQVKSNMKPWKFRDEGVRWLVEYPIPLFLACVDKKKGILRVYNVTGRFRIKAFNPTLPPSIDLNPEDTDSGTTADWQAGNTHSLSAPILKVNLADLIDQAKMRELRQVFNQWVRVEHDNCSLLRQGLLRFRLPPSYKTNAPPDPSIIQVDPHALDLAHLRKATLTTAEAVEFLGSQLFVRGDRMAGVLATLMVNHLRRGSYENFFDGEIGWITPIPGELSFLCHQLNKELETVKGAYDGVDEVARAFAQIPLVQTFLSQAGKMGKKTDKKK